MKTLCCVCLVALAPVAAPAFAKTLTIGIDLSESNPVVTSPEAAKSAASYARKQIAALQLGDTVKIRHFGERNAKNAQGETIRITRQARPNAVAEKVARYIAALPAKTTAADGATNIVAFLEFGQFDCKAGSKIILLTDGIESSSYVTGRQFLTGKPLPAPDANILQGCAVEMFGFGLAKEQGYPPQALKAMRSAWLAWMQVAGATFTAIIES